MTAPRPNVRSALRGVLSGVAALLILALAWWLLAGGLRDVPQSAATGQKIETTLRLACGLLGIAVVVTRFRWRQAARPLRIAWAVSLAASMGLTALVWGAPQPWVALLFVAVALLLAWALGWALGPAEGPRESAWLRRGAIAAGVLVAAFAAAVVLIPRVDTDDATYRVAMRVDLRMLDTAQESYFADSVTYSPSVDRLHFRPSAGVAVTIVEASDSGWSAVARSTGTRETCAMYVGRARPRVRGQVEGQPACE